MTETKFDHELFHRRLLEAKNRREYRLTATGVDGIAAQILKSEIGMLIVLIAAVDEASSA